MTYEEHTYPVTSKILLILFLGWEFDEYDVPL